MKTKLSILSIAASLFLISCGDDHVGHDQEEHLEPVAIGLENHETEEIVAVLYDASELPDSTSITNVTLAAGDTVELKVVALCLENGELEECDALGGHEGHDHDEEAHEEEGHEEEGEEEFTLKVSVADSEIVSAEVHSDEFAVELMALKAGETTLEIEIWHGAHADITGKQFTLTVE